MGSKMEKRYGLPTAISMVIGIVIGSGVFIKGGKVLALTHGNMLQGVLVVALVGAICIICSLVFAELGAKYEKVNGVVDYAEVALGPSYSYYVGWFMTTIYYPCLSAMLAFFSAPIPTLTNALLMSAWLINFLLSRAALIAASFIRFSKSAPVNPAVV